MKFKHRNYFNYEVPIGWSVDENDDSTSVYNTEGEGALTMSFYTFMEIQETLDEHISIMAKKFIVNNQIKLNASFILDGTRKDKKVLYGTGITTDNWFIKIWVIAKYPKVILATYQSEKKTLEIKKVDKLIESIQFT